jgi:hypothetical protein
LATRTTAFLRLLLPLALRHSACWALRSLRSARRKNFGAGTFRPSQVTAKCLNPRSIPTSAAICGNGSSSVPPKVALSKLVNSLKGVSSRRMRQEFPDLARHYYRANKLWSGSYFAGSVGGAPISVLRHYIETQNLVRARPGPAALPRGPTPPA